MKIYRIALIGFATTLAAFSQTSAPVADKSATQVLKEISHRTPADIANAADVAQAQLNQRKIDESKAREARTPRILLKEKFQREFAAASDEATRDRLIVEYHAFHLTLAAAEEIARQESIAKPGTKK